MRNLKKSDTMMLEPEVAASEDRQEAGIRGVRHRRSPEGDSWAHGRRDQFFSVFGADS